MEERQADRGHRRGGPHHRAHHHPAGHWSHPRQFLTGPPHPHRQAVN